MQRLSALLLAVVAAAVPLDAQWVVKPPARLDLAGRAPRTPEGRPDFSGIWKPERNRPCPPAVCNDMEVPQEFIDIGWSLKGGLPYQPWAAALRKERMSLNRTTDPNSRCLPNGIVRMHTAPLYRKMVQTPSLLLILNERNTYYRQIYIDGRPLERDPNPSWSGYSTAAWEGDTLVVRSNGFRDDLWLDSNGSPMTAAATITERFRRPNFGSLEIALTVDDPKAYTRPWTVTMKQVYVADSELLDYVCAENEKSVRHFGQ
ncbi:MAG TPA: hypothetical protein VN628_17025 [Vicinamibacterales bacterium]|nr:hypothetical protein [Vicinamibacterales bacterium]